MPKPGTVKRIKEKGRGLVPSRSDGAADLEYGAYLETLDPVGDSAVRLSLALSPDPRFTQFLERVSDPKWNTLPWGKAKSLQTIAKGCGISLQEFNNFGQSVAIQRALAIAQKGVASITSDMTIDAQSTMISCERCDGLTWVNAPEGLPEPTPGYRIWKINLVKHKDDDGNTIEEEVPVFIRDCPVCRAEGRVRSPGDEFSREKLLDMTGLIQKKGPMVAITQNFGGQTLASAVSRMDAITIDVESVSAGD